MRISDHHRRPDRHARSVDPGAWSPRPPLDQGFGNAGPPVAPIAMKSLLKESGSLTARLQKYGATKVRRVRQTRAQANLDERWFIGSSRRQRTRLSVMTREVVLEVDQVPWVFAHTLANAPAVRLLRRAGRNALAVVLFTDPQVIAGSLQYRRIDQRHPLYRAALKWCGETASGQPLSLIARRAMFRRGAARLLVTEVFLPAALPAFGGRGVG